MSLTSRSNGRGAQRAAGTGRGISADAADAGASRFGWATLVHRGQHQRSAALYERLGFLRMGLFELQRRPALADLGASRQGP